MKQEEEFENERPVAFWRLALGFAAIMAAFELADHAHGWATLAILGAGVAVFVFSGWRWGRDSRDGADHKPILGRAKATS